MQGTVQPNFAMLAAILATWSVPSQYIQKLTLVLAAAAVDTGRPLATKSPPLVVGPGKLA